MPGGGEVSGGAVLEAVVVAGDPLSGTDMGGGPGGRGGRVIRGRAGEDTEGESKY